MSKVSPDREIDRLIALPLDEFTAARNDAVKRLKKAGDDEAAERLAALAKPSVPVWTINQLARQDKAAVKALLDAAARLRKTQERALAGGDPGALRAAQADERQALRDLTNRAGEILEQAGRPASRAVLERIRNTIGAAALVEPARSALKAGRLTDELEMSGFDALTGLQPAPKRAQPKDELAERRQKKAEQQRELRRLQKQARDLDDRAKAAEAQADEAEEAAETARELAEERRRDADGAAADLAEFERTLN